MAQLPVPSLSGSSVTTIVLMHIDTLVRSLSPCRSAWFIQILILLWASAFATCLPLLWIVPHKYHIDLHFSTNCLFLPFYQWILLVLQGHYALFIFATKIIEGKSCGPETFNFVEFCSHIMWPCTHVCN